MKPTTMMLEDSKIDTPAHHGPDASRADQPTSAYDDVSERRITPQGRRLRRWLILANLVGWVLIGLIVRAFLF